MLYIIVDNQTNGNTKDKRDFYFYVISIKGDWKYLKQTFLLSRYASCEQAVALKMIFIKQTWTKHFCMQWDNRLKQTSSSWPCAMLWFLTNT